MPTEKIDHYIILKSLGKGGMGEVFLVQDPVCKRHVALKQIRGELRSHAIMKERFLREARVAAGLIHPSIVPIFSIDPSPEKTYYTMPYVEGETLKEILKQSCEEEKEGEIRHPIGSSILSLTRIFLSVCEAIAYTHSKKIVHRDLKPDNIIIGKYGEVLLLDWGLADFIGATENFKESELEEEHADLTSPGKVPGTLNYIAPERVRGESSTPRIDIYSLGVILYQLLTLRQPFHRTKLKQFRQSMHLEKLIDPMEIAPYRDIPQHLSDIAKRCLCYDPNDRFQTVDEIVVELKNFLEGKPEWVFASTLDMSKKQDWEFQENVLLAKHTAITRSPDVMEWVSLMISKAPFSGNIQIQTSIKISKESQGVGILLGIPDRGERSSFSQGYCLWLGGAVCRLFHNDVEVMSAASHLTSAYQEVCIESIDCHLFVLLGGKKILHYISQTPLLGSHVGICSKDTDFELIPLKVKMGSQNAMVNCLAIPDAFVSSKHYVKALIEYRRIANSFAGRSEGREAIFRAGIALLEQASSCKNRKKREELQLMALKEFGKLQGTPAAPLEYLGKSLVYKATGEIEEEIKCLELSLRKYAKHPLLKRVREHILFRLHETSLKNRVAAYHFALLSLRHLPQVFAHEDHSILLLSLRQHLEKVPFLQTPFPLEQTPPNDAEELAVQLAFWLFKPIPLLEIAITSSSSAIVANAMYALLAMGYDQWVEENFSYLKDAKEAALVRCALLYFKKGAKAALEALCNTLSASASNAEMRCAYFLFDRSLCDGKSGESLPYFERFPSTPLIDALHITTCLMQNGWEKAQHLLEGYPPEILGDEYSPLFVPMGCYLRHTEGEEIAKSHFGGSIDLPYPTTTMLLSYYLRGKISKNNGWMSAAFPFEKIALFRELILYFHCAKNQEDELKNKKQLKKELKRL
jgi:serine/threonine protein kinase